MATEVVRVRLVPKNRGGEVLPANLFAAAPRTAKAMDPDADRAMATLGKLQSLGVQGRLSRRAAIDALVPVSKFKEVFNCGVKEAKLTADKRANLAKPNEKTLVPKGVVSVPADLSDDVAFAYVPSPPEFFAPQPTPPNVSLFHLRVEDVARALGAYRCHRNGWTGRGIRAAMTDSGFAPHPFFDQYGFNIERVHTPSTDNPGIDPSGHGTGESANLVVVAPDCTFIGVKHDDYSALALETAIAQNPRIISNSWGYNSDTQSLDALEQSDPNLFNEFRDLANIVGGAIADGITVIFSAGNGHRAFPGSLPDVISAGGTTVLADGTRRASSYASSFQSQFYPGRAVPDFCGIVGEAGASPLKGHILLPVPNGCELEGENLPNGQQGLGWGIFSGTSAAAPQIAGIVALMLSVNPELTPSEIKSILSATCSDVAQGKSAMGDQAGTGVDLATGSGLVDAFQACLRVQQQLVPSPSPQHSFNAFASRRMSMRPLNLADSSDQ